MTPPPPNPPSPPLRRAPFGSGARSCLSSPVSGGSGCSQFGSKIADPASPGSPGPSSSRPSTPLVNSANSVSPTSSPQSAAAQLKNCLRSSQHTANQARTSMQLGKQKLHTAEMYRCSIFMCECDNLLISTNSLHSMNQHSTAKRGKICSNYPSSVFKNAFFSSCAQLATGLKESRSLGTLQHLALCFAD